MDRNATSLLVYLALIRSLSARRAWIEIRGISCKPAETGVALRKESVDRNPENPMISVDKIPSLSARRAWIEIKVLSQPSKPRHVALRKESVDRNFTWHCMSEDVSVALRKESVDRNLIGCINRAVNIMSLSARRAWIEIR